MALLLAAGRLRPRPVRDSFLLLREMLGRGGLALSCVEPAGPGRVLLTLQPDGNVFLRCTPGIGPAAVETATAAMAGVAARMAAATTTLAGLRTVLDAAVLAFTLAAAVAAFLSAGAGWAEVWRPALVFGLYASLVPLRRPLLRAALRLVLRSESLRSGAGRAVPLGSPG